MGLLLKNFLELDAKESALVLQWRNHRKVAPFMKHKQVALEEHLRFLESLKRDCTKAYFLVYENQTPIGVIDFVEIVPLQSCEFGIYQSPFLKGYGEMLMQEVLDYAFKTLSVKELKACVFKSNVKALELYLRFQFKIIKESAEMYNVSLSVGEGGVN